ncbi:type II secretion system F family protein [Bosea sp. RAC05]|uniref:type II secretion system F family protein n=1 Tax=Bosea sp. RAC05 TaxID=1842539 RepID=UPI00083D183B|nr:type II secretion system F family protein [Bosea sp. RAC05]AOG02901.1 type II secretion system (T2SS), F family protein [Bosea sp. RAC05]
MPSFKVRITGRGGPKTILVQASDSKEAARIAARQGRVLSTNRNIGIDIVPGMTVGERHTWMLRMSSMLGSKVSTGDALRLMASTFGGNIKKASAGMLERVEAGMSLPDAMYQDRKNFPSTTSALVQAGVATGDTWRALKDAADFEYKMSHTARGAMKQVYAAIGSFFVAYGLLLGTTMYFGPMVMDNPMFKNGKGVDVEWARTLGDVSTVVMTALVVVFLLFFMLGSVGKAAIPNAADWLIMKLPFYRDLILARNNHVTLYKLGLLVGSGVRIEEALKLAEEGAPRGALKTDLNRAKKAVKEGQKNWALQMKTLHDTDKAALTTSPDRKDIARTLDALAGQYAELYRSRVETLGPLMGTVSAIFITLAGGVMFAQTILPMLQLSAGFN